MKPLSIKQYNTRHGKGSQPKKINQGNSEAELYSRRSTGNFSEAANMIQRNLKNPQTSVDFSILIMYLWRLSKLS